MFGYATDETPELMPMTIMLAHKLNLKLAETRRNGVCPWLRPDTKTQVTIRYDVENGVPVPKAVDAVVISTQHGPEIEQEQLRAELMEKVIKPVIPAEMLTPETKYFLNPSGRFIIGGPQGDAGVTGRKIIGGFTRRRRDRRRSKLIPLFFCSRLVRRLGRARWWCLLRKGLVQGRPFGCLLCPLGRQVDRRCWPCPPLPRPGRLRHRCC